MAQDEELEGFKQNISLPDLAASFGYFVDPKESSRSSLVMKHLNGDKLIIATDTDGHGVFFSVKTTASGSVIDFVMEQKSVNLGRARQFLRAYSPSSSFPTGQNKLIPKPQPISHDRAALVAQWHRFKPCNPSYLISRGLQPEIISIFAGRIRTDERGNTVFRHDDTTGLCGWEIKNNGFTGYSSGGKKGLFAVRAGLMPETQPPCCLVLAESGIDALSYFQLSPEPALVLAFGGGLSPEQDELLRHVLTKYENSRIIAATDNDKQGEAFFDLIKSIRPDTIRKRPEGKDFNDDLQTYAKTHQKRPQGGLNEIELGIVAKI